MKKTVAIGMLGPQKDAGTDRARWDHWRPSIALCQQDDLEIDRYELFYQPRFKKLRDVAVADVKSVSPGTEVRVHEISFRDPWDFAEVYAGLDDFVRGYRFKPDSEDYLVHITTGSHAWQICLFLMAESQRIPARLIQTSPRGEGKGRRSGRHAVIDLDLSRYDHLAERFAAERRGDLDFLKAGIETKSVSFNRLMDRIEHVALESTGPILLTGATGVGKTQLARRIFELKKRHHLVSGEFVEVNCATLRGDAAMSALFGHEKGAFTGAQVARSGFLRAANGGVLFLDEIGELGLDEQAMLLRSIEEKRFVPMGSDRAVTSDFKLIAGTNRDLRRAVQAGTFREDLLARIDLWSFRLPSLNERMEDIEPNLEFELNRHATTGGRRATFNREARKRFLKFATNPATPWRANFRDFNAALTRMATLAPGGRINSAIVSEEMERLSESWSGALGSSAPHPTVRQVLGPEAVGELDLFELAQLETVLTTCLASGSAAAAGRALFAQSRQRRSSTNDGDRIAKYLGRFDLKWRDLQAHRATQP